VSRAEAIFPHGHPWVRPTFLLNLRQDHFDRRRSPPGGTATLTAVSHGNTATEAHVAPHALSDRALVEGFVERLVDW